jgi:hypothetical protein
MGTGTGDKGATTPGAPESVGALSQLYLGNILFALETTALALDQQGKKDDATFYRGIARKLAEAHGRTKSS